MFIVGDRFSRISTEQARHDTHPAGATQSARNRVRERLICTWSHHAAQRRLSCTWHRVGAAAEGE